MADFVNENSLLIFCFRVDVDHLCGWAAKTVAGHPAVHAAFPKFSLTPARKEAAPNRLERRRHAAKSIAVVAVVMLVDDLFSTCLGRRNGGADCAKI